MDTRQRILAAAAGCGLFETGFVPMESLRFYPEVRAACESGRCGQHDRCWACPPAVGTLEECRARVLGYDGMLLFSGRYTLDDPFDLEGMRAGLVAFKDAADRLDAATAFLPGRLILANEGCGRCAVCSWPAAPCRKPRALHHAIEGYGFMVHELAAAAGLAYMGGPNTVTYFGALLFHNTPGPAQKGVSV